MNTDSNRKRMMTQMVYKIMLVSQYPVDSSVTRSSNVPVQFKDEPVDEKTYLS